MSLPRLKLTSGLSKFGFSGFGKSKWLSVELSPPGESFRYTRESDVEAPSPNGAVEKDSYYIFFTKTLNPFNLKMYRIFYSSIYLNELYKKKNISAMNNLFMA